MNREENPMTNSQARRRASGQPVADELVASLADEAEAGYDRTHCAARAGADRSDPPPRK
jgi:hypothetical protein